MQKYLSFIMYYGSALLLFTHKLHCLQTFCDGVKCTQMPIFGLDNLLHLTARQLCNRPVPCRVQYATYLDSIRLKEASSTAAFPASISTAREARYLSRGKGCGDILHFLAVLIQRLPCDIHVMRMCWYTIVPQTTPLTRGKGVGNFSRFSWHLKCFKSCDNHAR